MPTVTGSWRRAVGPAVAIVGIALGTCVMVSSAAVGRGVERSIERTVEATLGQADFRISVPGGVVTDEIVVTIGSVLGVEVAAPAVEHATTLVPEVDTLAPAPASAPVTLLGIDPVLDGQVHQLDLVAGTTLTRRDEPAAVITERLAADDGYGLGSDVIVATPGEPERFRVVGIVSGDGPFLGSGGRTVILPIDAVSRMFGIDGVARVDLLVEDEIPLAGVRSELGEALAGEPHLVTSPADFAESLRLSTTGYAVSGVVVAGVGLLFGALFAFSALWLTAPEQDEVGRRGRLRSAAVPAAVGFGVGVVLATAFGAVAGPAGILAALVGVALAAVASAGWPRDRSATRLTVALLIVGLGLAVGLAMVAANARHTAVEPSIAAVVGPFIEQVAGLAVLAAAVTALGIVGAPGLRRQEGRPLGTAILGFAGAFLGSMLGLIVGATAIVVGGRSVDPSRDVPWGAIGLAFALGIGLSVAAAWVSGALRGAPGDRLGGRVRMAASGRLGRRVEGARAGPAKGRNGCSSRRRD